MTAMVAFLVAYSAMARYDIQPELEVAGGA